MKTTKLLLLVISIVATSCDLRELVKIKGQQNDSDRDEEPIARAHNNFLYPSDIEGILPSDISVEDSSALIQRYVRNWIRKQLLITEAASKMNFDEAEIERKILDYRFSLMGYQYQSYYVNQNLNKNIAFTDIKSYYDEHQENFELKQNIIRGRYVKIPKGAPQVDNVNTWLASSNSDDKEELKSYCIRFATSYSLEDSIWVNFDEMIKGTPIESISDKVNFLKNNDYIKLSDESNFYFIKINDYKLKEQISPVEFVADQIKNILINKRKIELANNLEDKVYKQALENNDFEIYE